MPATEASTADVAEGFAALAERAERWFEHEGIASADRHITRTVDMRYHGQNYELSVAVPDGPISKATLQALAAGFADVHRQRYGFVADGDPVQIVTLRVEATGAVRKAELLAHPEAGPDAAGAIVQRRAGVAGGGGRLRRHADLCPRRAASGQPLRRSRDRRADGRHDAGAARLVGAGRCVSQSHPRGGRMSSDLHLTST